MSKQIHPTAIVEPDVEIGSATAVWDNVHIRRGAKIGHHCIIGEKTYIAYNVSIGDFVKVNAMVSICAGVHIEDFCMLASHVVFTNDKYPRAGNVELTELAPSEPTDDTLATYVRRGTTIGANATIGPGVTLGEFSMVGMGAVVTKDVAAYQLVMGNPAEVYGWVCACGALLAKQSELSGREQRICDSCSRSITVGE